AWGDGPLEAARPRAFLGEDDAKSALHREAARGSAAPAGGIVSKSSSSVRAEAPDCRAGQPRASANSGAVVVEGRVRRAGSEGHSHLRVGLVSRRFNRGTIRSATRAKCDSRAGSVRAIPRALAGAAAGPGLFAD